MVSLAQQWRVLWRRRKEKTFCIDYLHKKQMSLYIQVLYIRERKRKLTNYMPNKLAMTCPFYNKQYNKLFYWNIKNEN